MTKPNSMCYRPPAGAGDVGEVIAIGRDRLIAAIAAELAAYFPGSPYGDPKLPEWEAHWIISGAIGRAIQEDLAGRTPRDDGRERFERAVDVVVKAPPQHKTKKTPSIADEAARIGRECAALPIWVLPPELERPLRPRTPFS